jgi:hypothetical protein
MMESQPYTHNTNGVRPVRSISRLLRALSSYCMALSAIAVMSAFTPLYCAPQETDKADRQIVLAQQFLQALQPEATHHDYLLRASKFGSFDSKWPSKSPLDTELLAPQPDGYCSNARASRGDTNPCEKLILTATFEFDIDGTLNHVRMGSVPSTVTRILNMRKVVGEHPDWSDSQISDALVHAGAKFGPSNHDALIHALPLEQLAPFIGPVTIKSAKFRFRHEQKPIPLAELYWDVDASSVLNNGSRVNWTFYFEPFGGTLTDLYRNPSDKP